MIDIDKYCDKVQKQTKKVLYKLFGKAPMNIFIKHRNVMRYKIESTIGYGIGNITEDDVKKYKIGYDYAYYKTLDNLIETYLKSVELSNFIYKEFEEYKNEY